MVENFEFKENYNIDDLLEVIRVLRQPGGCPWDREQTHKSIRKDLLEETYEVIEAINKEDTELLKEELGDLLMQVVFHSQIETEQGSFVFDDVCDGICKKMIIRHPHVFADDNAETSAEVLVKWDAIKKKTKNQQTQSSVIDSIPREFPALMRAQKVQKKAADVGFDWDDISGAFDKVCEETQEVREALESGDKEAVLDEIGDLFFACVNVSRFAKVDSEEALTHATDKFAKRFRIVEALAAERGIDMNTASIEVLDELWDEAKKQCNQ